MSVQQLTPVTLAGSHVRLEPLTLDHVPALAQAGLHPVLWELQPAPIRTEEDMRGYVATALDDQQRSQSLPFAIVRQQDGEVIGSTRYMDIALPHRRLEIGATWLSPGSQRSGANTEAKLLLLTHAFETLAMIRVVFKTELLNTPSRQALARIGAVEEGVFRQHLIAASGRRRDMVYLSILEGEWPQVKAELAARLR
ncbi:MAG: N-acetyltransferase [Comamonadaceae bacterium]|nr:MAG: N-acetyltransferase [Comamonadaceae bacterium]